MNRKGLLLGSVLAAAPLAWSAVTTNVWLTATGGRFHDATNWFGVVEDWTKTGTNRGFLDFRELQSGGTISLTNDVTFSGFWFGPSTNTVAVTPEGGEETGGEEGNGEGTEESNGDGGDPEPQGPALWTISGWTWKSAVGTLPLRVDDGELEFKGTTDKDGNYILRKEGNGTLVLRNTLAANENNGRALYIDEGEVRIAHNNALRHVTLMESESAGRLTVSNNITQYLIGRIYSTDTNKEPDNLEGKTAHIGGVYSDSVIAVPSTNGTYLARGHYTLMLGDVPEATALRGLDGDIEICTLSPALRDCVGFWRFENVGDPIHDSGLRGNTLVASGAPQVVTDPDRGNVLYLDGSSYLYGRNGNTLYDIPTANTPYTIAFWAKFPAPPAGNIGFAAFHWGDITGNKCNFLRFNPDGKLYHSHGDANGTARNKTYGGGHNVFNGAWHHFAIIHDGDAQLRYYIDGTETATADWSAYGTPAVTAVNFQIGNPWSASAISFVGYLDDFLILRRAMSAAEVAGLYAGQTDTANPLPDGIDFETTGNGALRLAADQTFSTLRGDTPLGGIRLQNNATLTLDGGSPSAPTQMVVKAGIQGSGSLRKDGANLDLVAGGSFDYSGDTEIAAGSLTLRTASDLAAWWQFEDPDNLGYSSERLNALDVVKYNNAVGAIDSERGNVGCAPDGTNNGILGDAYTGHSGFPVGNSPYTCAVWVKRDADCPNHGTFFWWGIAGSAGQSVQFRFINSYQVFALAHVGGEGYDFVNFRLSAPMPANEWHHVAATYDGNGTASGNGTLSVYYDGQLVKRETTAKAITIPTMGSVCVGKYSGRGDRTFKGVMDDARIYSRCLTDEEIAQLAAETADPVQKSVRIEPPTPVAWYTFDDPENPGKDSSPNGYDLTPVGDVAVTNSPVKGGMLSLPTTTRSYLKYADDDFPAKIPSGTKSFTITCWARTRFNSSGGPAVAWGEAVTSGSHSTILDIMGDWNEYYWRFVTLNSNGAAVQANSMQNALREGSDDLRLHHLAAVYDVSAKKWSLYVDGALSSQAGNANGCATPASNFYIGHKPSSATDWFKGDLDEVRIYDIPLTAAQVREVIRYDLAEGRGVLPPSTTVHVAQAAALHVETDQTVKGLSGTGAVTVDNATLRLTASPADFGGTLTGTGSLALPTGVSFPAATLSGFDGTVVLEGGKLSGAAVPASCDACIPDGTSLALADAPFAAIGGVLTVGGSGAFIWTGTAPTAGDYPIATASGITLETGDGWQLSPALSGIAKTRLSVRDNGDNTQTLLFSIIANGTVISIR